MQIASKTSGEMSQVHIFLKPTRGLFDAAEVKGTVHRMQRIGMLQSGEQKVESYKLYIKLFTSVPVTRILRGDKCLRKELYTVLGVESDNCQLCSNCLKHDSIAISSLEARRALDQNAANKRAVIHALDIMQSMCYVCRQSQCNGRKCMNKQLCFKCFGSKCPDSSNFDLRKNNFARKCEFKNPMMHGRACALCFLPQSLRIDGVTDKHARGQCVHKERLKRILLIGCTDGKKANEKLYDIFKDPTDWINTFAHNLSKVVVR